MPTFPSRQPSFLSALPGTQATVALLSRMREAYSCILPLGMLQTEPGHPIGWDVNHLTKNRTTAISYRPIPFGILFVCETAIYPTSYNRFTGVIYPVAHPLSSCPCGAKTLIHQASHRFRNILQERISLCQALF